MSRTLRKIAYRIGLLSLVCLLATSCVHHVLSEQVRLQADRTVTFAQLRAAPETYRERTVIVGGKILRTANVPEGTFLEVLHKPLDGTDRPLQTDTSHGRFFVRCDTQLDPAIYAPGREVTVAGQVLGTRTDKIGENDYVYPLLSCLQLALWPQTSYAYTPYNYGFVFSWEPWWWEPWWWGPHRHHFHRRWRGRYR